MEHVVSQGADYDQSAQRPGVRRSSGPNGRGLGPAFESIAPLDDELYHHYLVDLTLADKDTDLFWSSNGATRVAPRWSLLDKTSNS